MAGNSKLRILLLTSVVVLSPLFAGEATAQMPRPLPSIEVNLEVLRSLQFGSATVGAAPVAPVDPMPAPMMPAQPPMGADPYYAQQPPPVAQGNMPPPPEWAQQQMDHARSQMGLSDEQGSYSTYQPQPPNGTLPPALPPTPAAPATPAIPPAPDPLAQMDQQLSQQGQAPTPPPPPPVAPPAPPVPEPVASSSSSSSSSSVSSSSASSVEAPPPPPAVIAPLGEEPAAPPPPMPEVPKEAMVPTPPVMPPMPTPPTDTDLKIPDLPQDAQDWLKDDAPKPDEEKKSEDASPFPSLSEETAPPPLPQPEENKGNGLPDLESLPPIDAPSIDPNTPPPLPSFDKLKEEKPKEASPFPELPVLPDAQPTPPSLPPLPEAEEAESDEGGWFPGLTKTFKRLLSNKEEVAKPKVVEVAPKIEVEDIHAPKPPAELMQAIKEKTEGKKPEPKPEPKPAPKPEATPGLPPLPELKAPEPKAPETPLVLQAPKLPEIDLPALPEAKAPEKNTAPELPILKLPEIKKEAPKKEPKKEPVKDSGIPKPIFIEKKLEPDATVNIQPALPEIAPLPELKMPELKAPELPVLKAPESKKEAPKKEAPKPEKKVEVTPPPAPVLKMPEMPQMPELSDLPPLEALPPTPKEVEKKVEKIAEVKSPPPLVAPPELEIVEQHNQPVKKLEKNKAAEAEMEVAKLEVPKKLTPPPAPVKEAVAASAGVKVVYGRDATEVPAGMKAQLDALAKQAKDQKKRITVNSYASGSKEEAKAANMISLSRALALRAYMIEAGLPQDKIIVKAKGIEHGGGEPDRADVSVD